MRILHAGNDHERCFLAEQELESERIRDCARPAGQYLPLRHLPADSRGSANGGPAEVGMTSELTRRDFLSTLGAGVVVLCVVEAADAQESGRRSGGDARPQQISAWLHIGEDGVVMV